MAGKLLVLHPVRRSLEGEVGSSKSDGGRAAVKILNLEEVAVPIKAMFFYH
jgi:hypothetical protein